MRCLSHMPPPSCATSLVCHLPHVPPPSRTTSLMCCLLCAPPPSCTTSLARHLLRAPPPSRAASHAHRPHHPRCAISPTRLCLCTTPHVHALTIPFTPSYVVTAV